MRSIFDNLSEQQRRLFAIPPHPWVLRVAKENLEFERAMLSLASCVPCDLPALTEAFKEFAASRPRGWRDTVSYCKTYFLERGRFPFEVRSVTASTTKAEG